jgi:hypothetical protein
LGIFIKSSKITIKWNILNRDIQVTHQEQHIWLTNV